MRLFISINFDQTMVEALTSLQNELKISGVRGNFTRPENLHMTLAFIGDYANPQEIIDLIDSVPFSPFTIRLDGLKPFRDMYFAKIAREPALEAYVRRLRRTLADGGVDFDKKKFSPHITLVRRAVVKGGGQAEVRSLPDARMTVEKISLMRSDRGKQGMIYRELNS